MYYDLQSGKAIKNLIFQQRQLLVCRLQVSAGVSGIDNIAISDMIPSGFEIENLRLSKSLNISWLPGKSSRPDYMDIRDYRIILFTNLKPGESKDFYYISGVVNLGQFRLPVLGAEAMYNPEVHSYSDGGFPLINSSGQVIFGPGEYYFNTDYNDNRIVFNSEGENELYGIIDYSGRLILKPTYDMIYGYSSGMAKAKKNGKYGFLDINGNEALPFIYDEAYEFRGEICVVVTGTGNNKITQYINKAGKVSREQNSSFQRLFN